MSIKIFIFANKQKKTKIKPFWKGERMKTFLLLATLLLITNAYTFNYTSMTCGNKHKCSEMNTWKKACFYLEACGVKKLDRDVDGIPCEKDL